MGWLANITGNVSHALGIAGAADYTPAPYLSVNVTPDVTHAIDYARANGFPPKLADVLDQLEGDQPHNMVAADLSGFSMTSHELGAVNAPHANLAYAQIMVPQEGEVSLHDVNINGGKIESANGGLSLSGGYANGLITVGAFSDMTLDSTQGAGMRVDAHVSNMNAMNSHLPGFNADNATFTPVSQFKDSTMIMGSFKNANLCDVSFINVDLRDSNFEGAEIAGVDFTGSNLAGVKGMPSIEEMKAMGVKGLDKLAPGSLITRDDGTVEIAPVRGEALNDIVKQASTLATLQEQLVAGRSQHWQQESAQAHGYEDAAKACGHAINMCGAQMDTTHLAENTEVSSAGVAMNEQVLAERANGAAIV